MQFRAFEPGIEVYGSSIDAIIEGFSLFPTIALEKLVQRGIGELRFTGTARPEIVIDRGRWYPQSNWLSAFEDISQAVGSQVMYKIGGQVPKHAPFPSSIGDIYSALNSIDVAFHMNHRKNGAVMFDPTSGNMAEGIGHYSCVNGAHPRELLLTCKNPYPCDFDRGLVRALAARYEPTVEVTHAKEGLCRKNGDESCLYVVTW